MKAVLFALLAALMILPAAAQPRDQALIAAAGKGDLAAVERLVREGASAKAKDARGRTALLAATHGNHVAVARALIAAGADVNAKDDIEDSPYLYAGAEGRTEILQMMLPTADLKSVNRYGGTALIPAAHHGHPDAVRVLLATADRQGPCQQAGLDRAARGRDPGRWRAGAYRDRAAAGRGRRQRQHRGPREGDAAAAREAARVCRDGADLGGEGRKMIPLTPAQAGVQSPK